MFCLLFLYSSRASVDLSFLQFLYFFFFSLTASATVVTTTSVDIRVSANLELVNKFCYLGDMLNIDGHVDAAVEARI